MGVVVGIEGPVVLIASTVAWPLSATVALMLGVGVGVGDGSALSTAAWTRTPMSGVGVGACVGLHARTMMAASAVASHVRSADGFGLM